VSLTPPRKAILYVVDPDTGRTYPILATITSDGKAMIVQSRYKWPGWISLFSGSVSSNGATSDINVSQYSALELELKVTSVSGTSPTLSVYVEGKFEGTGDYKPLAYQEGITSTGTWFFTIDPLRFRYIRVRWVVGGTIPSFTFAVVGEAVV
jgi:hypothetical protein